MLHKNKCKNHIFPIFLLFKFLGCYISFHVKGYGGIKSALVVSLVSFSMMQQITLAPKIVESHFSNEQWEMSMRPWLRNPLTTTILGTHEFKISA
jgi:hypothetical protein